LLGTSILGTVLATGLLVSGFWVLAAAAYAATLALVAAFIKFSLRRN
jgi:hypothetical protein